jgi:hypothetical protein
VTEKRSSVLVPAALALFLFSFAKYGLCPCFAKEIRDLQAPQAQKITHREGEEHANRTRS